MSWAQYSAWRSEWDRNVQSLSRPRGFATPVCKAIGRGGPMYAQLVLEALDTNRLTMAEAARALNLRTERFDRLRQRLVQGSTTEAADE